MSKMEFFHGYFEKSDIEIEPEDTDDFYSFEEEHGCRFIKVNGDLYAFWGSGLNVDDYGFSTVVPPTYKPQLMLYWYNGGASIHEVAESAIKDWLKSQTHDGHGEGP